MGGGGGGGMGAAQFEEVPDAVKGGGYKCTWWFLTVVLFVSAVCCFVAVNIFGGLIMLMIACWSYYMVKDDCAGMSQYCMFCFGMMVMMQAVFELIPLCMSLGGRRKQVTTPTGGTTQEGMHGTSSTSYTVSVVTTPFFDESQGWHYNFQSGMMIATFVIMLIAALVTYVTYKAYPRSLWDDDEESQSLSHQAAARNGGGRQQTGGGGYSTGGGQFNGRGAAVGGGGGGRAVGPQVHAQQALFSGSGQRLGS